MGGCALYYQYLSMFVRRPSLMEMLAHLFLYYWHHKVQEPWNKVKTQESTPQTERVKRNCTRTPASVQPEEWRRKQRFNLKNGGASSDWGGRCSGKQASAGARRDWARRPPTQAGSPRVDCRCPPPQNDCEICRLSSRPSLAAVVGEGLDAIRDRVRACGTVKQSVHAELILDIDPDTYRRPQPLSAGRHHSSRG